MKHLKILFVKLLCGVVLAACDSSHSDMNPQTYGAHQPQTQLYNKTFEQMANYDNYIIGTTFESERSDNPAENYIAFVSDGQEYRLE